MRGSHKEIQKAQKHNIFCAFLFLVAAFTTFYNLVDKTDVESVMAISIVPGFTNFSLPLNFYERTIIGSSLRSAHVAQKS
jgi:hypothetical protein